MVVALPITSSLADSTAGFYNGGGSRFNFDRGTGYFFTPMVDLTVTALGVFDHGTPGFVDSHDAGIFLSDGTLVASIALPSGLPGYAADGSRFLSIPNVSLSSGTQYYIIGNNWLTDQYAFGNGAVTYAPEITWNGFGDSDSNSIFDHVTNLGGLPGDLGPNFQFTVVPEPGSVTLFGLGGMILLLHRRK